MDTPVIESVVFRDDSDPALAWLGPGRRTVAVAFSDGRTIDLLAYYADEHTFSEGSFAGLTEAEARARFRVHDVAYLRD